MTDLGLALGRGGHNNVYVSCVSSMGKIQKNPTKFIERNALATYLLILFITVFPILLRFRHIHIHRFRVGLFGDHRAPHTNHLF
jgi:hypothetical protein